MEKEWNERFFVTRKDKNIQIGGGTEVFVPHYPIQSQLLIYLIFIRFGLSHEICNIIYRNNVILSPMIDKRPLLRNFIRLLPREKNKVCLLMGKTSKDKDIIITFSLNDFCMSGAPIWVLGNNPPLSISNCRFFEKTDSDLFKLNTEWYLIGFEITWWRIRKEKIKEGIELVGEFFDSSIDGNNWNMICCLKYLKIYFHP